LEDDLMRLFGSDRIARLMDRLGAQEGEVLTHALITRSIEQAQKRVELQNFQARKRLLEYDDVMNQQREVIYSLRLFALEGGEELKGEAVRMIDKAVAGRVDTVVGIAQEEVAWDYDLLRQELLMHYLLLVPELESPDLRPTTIEAARAITVDAGRRAFTAKLVSLDGMKDDQGQGYGDRLLSLVMLNVLDEKWKDHLYDLDQLRNAIHYRSWGQKDPLVEYKHEAYVMFVDLMSDIYNTFADRFLKVQLQFGPPAASSPPNDGRRTGTRRFNALGVAEDDADTQAPAPEDTAFDIGPGESPKPGLVARRDPLVVGAGRPRSLAPDRPHVGDADWTTVGRNDPCPCGSGKKFKKCHGATV
jgi:preprotein translocase subunit SecA